MRGPFGLAAEFHALRLPAALRARRCRRRFSFGVSTTGSASERRPAAALHVAGGHQKVGRVARDAVNHRDDDNIAVAKGSHQLLKLRRAGHLLADRLFAAGRLSC
jgi:hypothetical protein